MNSVLQTILSILGLCGGISGILTFVIQWRNGTSDKHARAVDEWKDLYNAMAERLNTQESLNVKLKEEVDALRKSVVEITAELANYKRYDTYITEIEAYTDELLAAFHTVVSPEAYATVASRRPSKRVL